MHRRRFLAASAALLLPAGTARAFQGKVTPAATPAHHGRPRPIVLGEGIELIDYRIYPSTDVPRIIGEISSTRDEMVDSPVVSITFPDLGEDGLSWAPPVLPVMRPGESNMIFGVLPSQIDSEEQLQEADFGLCAPVRSGPLTSLHASLNLRIELIDGEHWETAQWIQARIHNDAEEPVQWTKIRGLVRDSHGRYVGATGELDMWSLWPEAPKEFTLWLSTGDEIAANPYRLLNGSSTYFTDLFPGTIGNITAPACASVFD